MRLSDIASQLEISAFLGDRTGDKPLGSLAAFTLEIDGNPFSKNRNGHSE
ncbi:hypothetical protein BSIN_0223 [Burkholderia singularis]|uniref:Uncharacterized protein n=1 Tax=Burkholderia singularis TaxID=1503053 RepID=A0A238H4C3_9BURK|nr:hypothetical protein BSIN_0223 [Burkholderia singularis]